MTHKLILFALTIGGALLFAGCTADNGDDGAVVEARQSQFQPKELTVEPGTEVTWINRDSIQHNVVSDEEGSFESNYLNGGQSYKRTFDEPGIYPYHCTPHSVEENGEYKGMVGTIIVLNEDGSRPEPSTGGDNQTADDNETAQ